MLFHLLLLSLFFHSLFAGNQFFLLCLLLIKLFFPNACVHACMRACVRACVRACACACMRARVHVCVWQNIADLYICYHEYPPLQHNLIGVQQQTPLNFSTRRSVYPLLSGSFPFLPIVVPPHINPVAASYRSVRRKLNAKKQNKKKTDISINPVCSLKY